MQIFHNIFLNTDISLNISNTALKSGLFDLCSVMQGSISQSFHLGPRSYFIKMLKLLFEKLTKSFSFFNIKYNLRPE